jgi:hypothetical protein
VLEVKCTRFFVTLEKRMFFRQISKDFPYEVFFQGHYSNWDLCFSCRSYLMILEHAEWRFLFIQRKVKIS